MKPLDEIKARMNAATAGPYEVEKVDLDGGGIAYEVSARGGSFHVAFYEHNCLDQRITAKNQAKLYAHARTDIPRLVKIADGLLAFLDNVEGSTINELDVSKTKEWVDRILKGEGEL